jgi:hypothetical protein
MSVGDGVNPLESYNQRHGASLMYSFHHEPVGLFVSIFCYRFLARQKGSEVTVSLACLYTLSCNETRLPRAPEGRCRCVYVRSQSDRRIVWKSFLWIV